MENIKSAVLTACPLWLTIVLLVAMVVAIVLWVIMIVLFNEMNREEKRRAKKDEGIKDVVEGIEFQDSWEFFKYIYDYLGLKLKHASGTSEESVNRSMNVYTDICLKRVMFEISAYDICHLKYFEDACKFFGHSFDVRLVHDDNRLVLCFSQVTQDQLNNIACEFWHMGI